MPCTAVVVLPYYELVNPPTWEPSAQRFLLQNGSGARGAAEYVSHLTACGGQYSSRFNECQRRSLYGKVSSRKQSRRPFLGQRFQCACVRAQQRSPAQSISTPPALASAYYLVLEHKRSAREPQGRGRRQPQPLPTMEFANGAAGVFSGHVPVSGHLKRSPAQSI